MAPDALGVDGPGCSTLVEDESYFWTISRYVHLNPVRGKRPLASHPAEWPWSSYSGYARSRDRVGWVAYEAIYAAWQGEVGGRKPEAAYRRFVEEGLAIMPENPFRDAAGGWLPGGPKFVKRMRALMTLPRQPDAVPAARRLACYDYRAVLGAVAEHYGIAEESFLQQHSGAVSRDLAAWLARQLTPATLRELSAAFGLTHPDSVRNLIRRADRTLLGSRSLRNEIEAIRQQLLKTENRT
jgi:hypothetical protein